MSKIDNMPPKKVYIDLPPNLTFDISRGQFRYKNKITGKRKYVGSDPKKAIELAEKANLAIELSQHKPIIPTFDTVIDKMLNEWLDIQPWSDGYKNTARFRLKAIKSEWGELAFSEITRKRIKDWLKARCNNGETFNKWRELLIKVWDVAIEEELTQFNEAAATIKMSTSNKLEVNRKKRKRLTVDAFWSIHDHPDTPLFLQIAMEQSLVTLQSRQQVANTKLSDYKDGFLYYIREKTAGDTEMSFIKIEITEELDLIRRRSMNSVVSPFLVNKKPLRRDPDKMKKKPHWTYIWPSELGRAFQKARDKTNLFNDWLPEEKPTFHEIRSLGGRIYKEMGYPKEYIQALMTHTDQKTTEIYLTNPENLTSDHYRKVQAGMSLNMTKTIKL